MKPSETTKENLTSLNDIISPESQAEPQVTKITRKIVTTTQPVTQTYTTKRVITTTTKVGQPIQNTRYNNTSSSNTQNITKINTTSYTRPVAQATSSSNRPVNNNNRSINTQSYKNYQKPVERNKPQSRVQNSQSYSGNRNQPKRIEISSSNYKPRFNSPNPGSEKRKTINRGKPVENVQITHIIYSLRPLDFHITEDLNTDNLNSQPINISEEKRKNLQKVGKIEVTCSCDNVDIKPKTYDLNGTLTHFQHAQGIGMTDDKKENINPQFYSSEIKVLEPMISKKGEPRIEILEFRSEGKHYKTDRQANKPSTKPVIISTTNRSVNSYTPSKSYNNANQYKNYSSVNNKGGFSGVKTTTTSSNYRGSSNTGNSGQIVKETTTKVQMGSRSQYQPSQAKVTTSTERKVYNQNSFFKK